MKRKIIIIGSLMLFTIACNMRTEKKENKTSETEANFSNQLED